VFTWKIEPLTGPLLDEYFGSVQHAYKQVREILGANLNELAQLQWYISAPNLDTLLLWNIKSQGGLNVNTAHSGVIPTTPNSQMKERVDNLFHNLATWRRNRQNDSKNEDYSNASKTGEFFLFPFPMIEYSNFDLKIKK